jgi:catechol 2,3-dioxygenase-like lactoylglutathione lyase family enzyme
LQRCQEFFRRHLGLPQDASERAHLDFFVHGNHATLGLALHDDVAAALTNFGKTQTLATALYFGSEMGGSLGMQRFGHSERGDDRMTR